MSILVINAGSSSVKFALFCFEDLQPRARGLLDWAGEASQATVSLTPADTESITRAPISRQLHVPDYRSGVMAALELLEEAGLVDQQSPIRVVGHRLIHGGEEIRRPVWIDAAMKEAIARYTHLAPLHIPAGLEAIAATETALPDVPQAGLFDTAFFAHVPPAAYLYPLPYQWYEDWGIRRFGFHGISHAYCTSRASEMLGSDQKGLRLVICHLGQGASATAVRDGVAVTNTMGFTPLEGFPMGSRSGTVDPGILLYVMREKGLSIDQLDGILHNESGLLGMSGVSSDFRQVETAAEQGHPRAQLALDVYTHRVRELIGSLTVTLGGIDALVFTGGIGENSSRLRADVCRGLECLGLHLDTTSNDRCHPDTDVATTDSAGRILVIHTREDLMIAREGRQLLLDRS